MYTSQPIIVAEEAKRYGGGLVQTIQWKNILARRLKHPEKIEKYFVHHLTEYKKYVGKHHACSSLSYKAIIFLDDLNDNNLVTMDEILAYDIEQSGWLEYYEEIKKQEKQKTPQKKETDQRKVKKYLKQLKGIYK